MIKKLLLKLILGKNEDYFELLEINGRTYKAVVEPYVTPAESIETWFH